MQNYKDVEIGGIYETSNHGFIEVLDIKGSTDVDVRFLEPGYTTKAEVGQIRRGSVKDWSSHLSKNVGKSYPSTTYGEFEIVEYKDSRNVLIRFINTGFEGWYTAGNILKGRVMDYTAPSFAGVGFMGVGPHNSGNQKKAYQHWTHMLQRCYVKTEDFKNYWDCTVNPIWHNFQNFTNWAISQVGFYQNWQLDKDILQQGNKEYDPAVCCFVPARINSLVIKSDVQGKAADRFGTIYFSVRDSKGGRLSKGFKDWEEGKIWYKQQRESIIRDVADEYKNVLDKRVYDALYSWQAS